MGSDEPETWKVDPALLAYASENDREKIEALNRLGSQRAAAAALGCSKNAVLSAVERTKVRAAVRGFEQDPRRVRVAVADPYIVKGKATYWNKYGNPTQEWVKTRLDQEAYLRAVQEAMRAFAEDIEPISAAPGPVVADNDIIPWIQIGDGHLGMLAHAAETGQNFDLKIAEREMTAAIGILIDEIPFSERLVLNDLGDFTHYENFAAKTEASGHDLDYDSRFPLPEDDQRLQQADAVDRGQGFDEGHPCRRDHQPGQPQPHQRYLDGRAPTDHLRAHWARPRPEQRDCIHRLPDGQYFHHGPPLRQV
jgi:hypothetical protein